MSDKKRRRDEAEPPKITRKSLGNEDDEDIELDCEDPFEDEIEEEVIVQDDDDDIDAMEEDEEEGPTKVWRPNIDQLAEGETLDYDSNAYELFHVLNADWPCLSLDIISDNLGYKRTAYPHTIYFVAGTQAGIATQNKILVLKASELHKTKHDDSDNESGSESDDEALDDDPVLESSFIKHNGCVNRIRAMPQKPGIVATWSDSGSVHVWDLSAHIKSLDQPGRVPNAKPVKTFTGHSQEGFSMDWSPVSEGRLLTGDCSKYIYMWNYQAGSWTVDTSPYVDHTDSVEDLQWSPNEDNVFASCSVDKTIKIWDSRKKNKAALSIQAHDSDVNVISWNRIAGHALLSGGDDGVIRAWDLRKFESNSPTASFSWHRGSITSVGWSPFEGPVLAAASADNTISLWDLSLEADKEEDARLAPEVDVPPQLLFVHQGQADPKELRWHPQIPGLIVSTGSEGFNTFKTINS